MDVRLLGIAVLSVWLAACSGERGLSCETSDRYQISTTAEPLRVPDDLSPPDESEALVIPEVPETELASRRADATECLESPPDFFESQESQG